MFFTESAQIVVTGATGWVGRSFLDMLRQVIPASHFNTQVLAIGSKPSTLHLRAFSKEQELRIPVFSLAQLPSLVADKPIFLVHTAFLTKDRLSVYGYNDFVRINQSITSIICDALSRATSARVVEISSGAALSSLERKEDSLEFATDPYGFLKLQEESFISALADTQVFRIFALSGRFIRDPASFALGDFLQSAQQKKQIHLNSRHPVIRGYVNASDLACCALRWLFSGDSPSAPISAVSDVIALKCLAELISKIYRLDTPVFSETAEGKPDSYCSSPILFTSLCRSFGFQPMTITEQIFDTSLGLGH